jgi:hypothetical protein
VKTVLAVPLVEAGSMETAPIAQSPVLGVAVMVSEALTAVFMLAAPV